MSRDSDNTLQKLRNLGPTSEAMLCRAGITTVAQLRKLGAVRAYMKVKAYGASRAGSAAPSLNLLWAIEGALTNRDWKEVAKTDRLPLLMEVERLEKGTGLNQS